MPRRVIKRKVERLARGERPRVLDLFSGCGGVSLGFHRAGCDIIGGLEMDALAARSHALNFHGGLPQASRERHQMPRDITTTDPLVLMGELGHPHPRSTVDVLVGGPPCPAFTRVGRAKLREVHQHPEAFRHDPRAQLYVHYLRYVQELRPVAILMENVPDVLNFGGHNLGEEIADVLEGLGYRCAYTLLNSAHYGVPQMRERFILLAIHRAAGAEPAFPQPTRTVDFPWGYELARTVALKVLRSQGGLFGPRSRYVPSPAPPPNAPPPVSVEEALRDLPPIIGHLDGSLRRGARRFDEAVTYHEEMAPSSYGLAMREWPGFETDGWLWDHVIRSLGERDHRLFRTMRPGDDYPRAHALAQRLFEEALAEEAEVQGRRPSRTSILRKDFVPPYDPGKFPNRWRKMEPDLPARTLMAHLGKDSYSHIHYDSDQARTISVREAARLQSFPDGFQFCGTMNPAFRQIGNAVPPLLAYEVARSLLTSLGVKVLEPLERPVTKPPGRAAA